MAVQIVKTQKRMVWAASGTNNDIGVTATAFFDVAGLSATYGLSQVNKILADSGITNGSASISRIVSGSNSFTVGMSNQTLFTGQAVGEYNFERWTLRPVGVNPDGTLDIVAGTGTVFVEIVL